MKKTSLLLLLFAAFALLSAYFFKINQKTIPPTIPPSPEVSTTPVTTSPLPPTENTNEQEVAITASSFKFNPAQIKVKKGEKLVLAVTNAEGFHDLVIDELKVNTGMIKAGETKMVTVPTDQPGTYEYYCSVGNHRAQGMKGTLIIE